MKGSDFLKELIFPAAMLVGGFYLGIVTDLTNIVVDRWKNYNAVRIEVKKEITSQTKNIVFSLYRFGDKDLGKILFDFAIKNEYKKSIKLKGRPEIRQTAQTIISKPTIGVEDVPEEQIAFRLGIKGLHRDHSYEFVAGFETNTPNKLKEDFFDHNVRREDDQQLIVSHPHWYDFVYEYPTFVLIVITSWGVPGVAVGFVLFKFRKHFSSPKESQPAQNKKRKRTVENSKVANQ